MVFEILMEVSDLSGFFSRFSENEEFNMVNCFNCLNSEGQEKATRVRNELPNGGCLAKQLLASLTSMHMKQAFQTCNVQRATKAQSDSKKCWNASADFYRFLCSQIGAKVSWDVTSANVSKESSVWQLEDISLICTVLVAVSKMGVGVDTVSLMEFWSRGRAHRRMYFWMVESNIIFYVFKILLICCLNLCYISVFAKPFQEGKLEIPGQGGSPCRRQSKPLSWRKSVVLRSHGR